jgi:hypothetical protein
MKRISNLIFCFTLLSVVFFGLNYNYNDPIIEKWAPKNDVVEMPLVFDTKHSKTITNVSSSPIEQRGEEYRKYLSSSLKITVGGANGSGTICYYDPAENWAYVISCGHLWEGNKSYKELQKEKLKATVTTWYKNDKKLESPKSYEAEILFWSNSRGYDCSALRFRPDWKPEYFPIAQMDYKLNKGMKLNSLGCDGAKEVARYEVEFEEYRGLDLITQKNSPRPGRSGGGLITDSGWYVGICWGTSDTVTGGGIGYFTPLKSIHEVFIKNGHEWLIRLSEFSSREIPIKDWNNPTKEYEKDYIPLPKSKLFTSFF